ncbi:MAG: FtsX-like permease family protein [Chloroflexia bacterium]|nr:FtsX-like permease family protein [Chloroflexia bacterium]
MIKFLLKGLLRDRSRSVLPIIVVALGVALTVFFGGFLEGFMNDMISQNARFETGHVKIMTRAYEKNKDQLPLDLALLGVDSLVENLESTYPEVDWVKRIRFGGLLDVPDKSGETKGQGTATGLALELFSEESSEINRMELKDALVSGTLPKQAGEALVSDEFAKKLNVQLGDEVTYFGSTMNGSMAFRNFTVSGTVRFGVSAMDKGAIVIDISDAQQVLDMENGTSEILGYLPTGVYDNELATQIMEQFNQNYAKSDDEFAPVMVRLRDQNNLASMLDYVGIASTLFIGIFVFAMSIVLWNTGLIAGLRRYKEFGIRLALGESKGEIYRAMISEAVLIGSVGSLLGTAVGLGLTYYMQVVGLDIGQYLDNAGVMMPSVMRAKVTPILFVIGFIPGLLAMVLGNMLAGIGIYKRETATLFKELEV